MSFNIETPSPIFGGSTGGWLRAAEVEEKYAITWTSPKEQIFEMPTGGAAIMRLRLRIIKFIEFSQVVKYNTCILKMAFSQKKLMKDVSVKIINNFQSVKIQIQLQLSSQEKIHSTIRL